LAESVVSFDFDYLAQLAQEAAQLTMAPSPDSPMAQHKSFSLRNMTQ
jgi:hypothetical protein